MNDPDTSSAGNLAFHSDPPPSWSLRQNKGILQTCWDFAGSPLRMVLLPDGSSEKLHLTSLRAERFRMSLPHLTGRLLDVGCGDNMLIRLYKSHRQEHAGLNHIGVDVEPWTDDVVRIESSDKLPFPDESFDSIAFLACLNHIPERRGAMVEARRLLKPGGKVVATMIGRLVGVIGHAIWWYSEDKHRDMHPEEQMGLDHAEMLELGRAAGLNLTLHRPFGYGLNNLYVFSKPDQ